METRYYTSHETSVALREAGAPQDGDYSVRRLWTTYGGKLAEPMLTHGIPGGTTLVEGEARAFRLDEILEALDATGDFALDNHRSGQPPTWSVRYAREDGYSCGAHASLVEAAAACWLAGTTGEAMLKTGTIVAATATPKPELLLEAIEARLRRAKDMPSEEMLSEDTQARLRCVKEMLEWTLRG